MAIINSITIGKGRRSLGNVTLRVRKGVTIASQKIESKTGTLGTENQVRHRVHWSNLVNAYKRLITTSNFSMNVAFPGASGLKTSYNEFMSINTKIAEVFAPALTKQGAEENYVVPAPFVISKGDLEPPSALIASFVRGDINLSGEGYNWSNLGDVARSLIEDYGCQNGDVLTMINMQCDGQALFAARRLVLDVDSSESLPVWIASNGIIRVDVRAGRVVVNEGTVIRGRNDNSVIRVSSAQFGDGMTSTRAYTDFTSVQAVQAAMDSYGYRPNGLQ